MLCMSGDFCQQPELNYQVSSSSTLYTWYTTWSGSDWSHFGAHMKAAWVWLDKNGICADLSVIKTIKYEQKRSDSGHFCLECQCNLCLGCKIKGILVPYFLTHSLIYLRVKVTVNEQKTMISLLCDFQLSNIQYQPMQQTHLSLSLIYHQLSSDPHTISSALLHHLDHIL